MSDQQASEPEAPPAGEHIHMPAPSILPVLNAAGLAVALVGITEGLAFLLGGLILFLVTTVIWIRAAARETQELPAEHH